MFCYWAFINPHYYSNILSLTQDTLSILGKNMDSFQMLRTKNLHNPPI